MGVNVFANGSEIACQQGAGQVTAAFPDVCLSPPSPPAGPLPVPYPDTSASKDTQNGSQTVQIQGGPVMLKDQSYYATSPLGNEAATNTFGGCVVTSVITGKTYFIAWSSDVQFEGENVDRHLDMTTSNHSAAQPGSPPPMPNCSSQTLVDIPPVKFLRGKVTAVKWDGLSVAYAKGSVKPPHWKEGDAVEDGGEEKVDGTKGGTLNGSKRPGVYKVGGAATATVTVVITENVNVSGKATLMGQLGGFDMQGPCDPSKVGTEQDVPVQIKKLPDSIQWYRGNVSFALDVDEMGFSIALENRPRLEVFVILDQYSSFYKPGTFTEALRFLCRKVGVIGLKTADQVAAQVATYCHSKHHTDNRLEYDTVEGASKYGCHMEGGDFQLLDYIRGANPKVNCYDQAAAVQALCGAVGAAVHWLYLEPFGFIRPTRLVGVGGGADCNNPFFMSNGTRRLMVGLDPDWQKKGISPTDFYLRYLLENQCPERTSFGRHAFAGIADKVIDACGGPHTGSESKAQYCDNSIDTTTTIYQYVRGIRFGKSTEVEDGDGLQSVE
jgi:hypothetical protein